MSESRACHDVLCFRGVHKHYPGVRALDGVDLTVRAGEIHALVGENGAGKSTLMNVACGLAWPDGGELLLDGRPIQVATPAQARSLGLALAHQEPDLYPDLSVTESMLLGRGLPANALGWIDWSAARAKARDTLEALGERMDVRRPGRALGAASRQMVDIAAALAQDVRVLFLDEPTASLSRKESEALFERLRALRARGVALVYVSHRLEEVLTLADRVTVLRDGKVVWTRPREEVTGQAMIAAMVGREVAAIHPRIERATGSVCLEARNVSTADGACRDVSLSLRAGEVVGVYGLIGAGRSEFAQALAGLRPRAGEVRVDDRVVRPHAPAAALRAGMAYLPEDRLDQALFHEQPTKDNITVAVLREVTTAGFLRAGRERAASGEVVEQLRIKVGDVDDPVEHLSGGNQQKVVLGRWLRTSPKVLLLDEPTRGVDVGAKAEIHRLIQEAAAQGMAVLLISSELPEVMGASDRVLVFRQGRIAAEFDPRACREADIAAAAFPRADQEAAHRAAPAADPWWTQVAHALLARRELGLLAMIVLLGAYLGVSTDSFLTGRNLTDILYNIAPLAIAGVGMTLIISAGAIDISVGSMLALCAYATAYMVREEHPLALAIPAGIGLGAAMGMLNGAVTVYGRVHSIIVTLGMMGIYRSLLILWTKGKWISGQPDHFTYIGRGVWLGLPIVVWVMFLAVALGALFQARMHAGRCLYAVGGNPRAARAAGIDAGRYVLLAFGLAGALVGVASVLYAARLDTVQTNAGLGFELRVIAATVIGGANIMGGSGTVVGTMLGALLIEVLYNARVLLNWSPYWEQLIIGALILLAVLIDAWLRRRTQRGAP